jgi:hypothetical protein
VFEADGLCLRLLLRALAAGSAPLLAALGPTCPHCSDAFNDSGYGAKGNALCRVLEVRCIIAIDPQAAHADVDPPRPGTARRV